MQQRGGADAARARGAEGEHRSRGQKDTVRAATPTNGAPCAHVATTRSVCKEVIRPICQI